MAMEHLLMCPTRPAWLAQNQGHFIRARRSLITIAMGGLIYMSAATSIWATDGIATWEGCEAVALPVFTGAALTRSTIMMAGPTYSSPMTASMPTSTTTSTMAHSRK